MNNDIEQSQKDFHKIFFNSESDSFSFTGVFVSDVDRGLYQGAMALTPLGRVVILVYSDLKYEKHMGYEVFESIQDLLNEPWIQEKTTSELLREATTRNIPLSGPCKQECCVRPREMSF